MLNGPSFAPEEPVTRAQSCVLMDRCSGIPDGMGTPSPTPTPTITPTSGQPTLVVTPSSATVLLPGQTSQSFAIQAKDGGGKPYANLEGTISTNFGKLNKLGFTTDTSGKASFSISSSEEGSATILISAGNLTTKASCTWTNQPLIVGTIQINPTSETLQLPGETTANFNVTVKDQNNNLMAGQEVTLSTELGTLSSVTVITDQGGKAPFSISSTNAGTANITASAGGKSASATCKWVPQTVSVTLSGQCTYFGVGCTNHAQIKVLLDGVVKASATSDDQGNYSCSFQVPGAVTVIVEAKYTRASDEPPVPPDYPGPPWTISQSFSVPEGGGSYPLDFSFP